MPIFSSQFFGVFFLLLGSTRRERVQRRSTISSHDATTGCCQASPVSGLSGRAGCSDLACRISTQLPGTQVISAPLQIPNCSVTTLALDSIHTPVSEPLSSLISIAFLQNADIFKLVGFLFSRLQQEVPACKASELDFLKADSERISRFQSLVRIPTISKAPRDYDREQLLRLHQQIRQSQFPVSATKKLTFNIKSLTLHSLAWCPSVFLFNGPCPPLDYPLVFSAPTIDVEIVANYSILLTWRGEEKRSLARFGKLAAG